MGDSPEAIDACSSSHLRLRVILTTYRRSQRVVELLGQLRILAERVSDRFDLSVLVADDDPRANWFDVWKGAQSSDWVQRIDYRRRRHNLGQGPNFVAALFESPDFDYFWAPGDDDQIDVAGFCEFLSGIAQHMPTLAVCGFAQGSALEHGTSFSGPPRVIRDVEEAAPVVADFGKGTNLVFLRPDEQVLSWCRDECSYSMYTDRAIAFALLYGKQDSTLYVYPAAIAFGGAGYGKLRYSTRVFVNLARVEASAARRFGLHEARELPEHDSRQVWRWWARGLKWHFHPRSDVSYTSSRLARELLYPIKRLLASWFGTKATSPFEPPDVVLRKSST